MPTELTVPMSAVSTPRARGGLCLKGRNLSWVGGGRVAVAWANGRASLGVLVYWDRAVRVDRLLTDRIRENELDEINKENKTLDT